MVGKCRNRRKRTPDPKSHQTRSCRWQKGRTCRIWWKRGERPPGFLDQRYVDACIYAAIEPGTDNAFALTLAKCWLTSCR